MATNYMAKKNTAPVVKVTHTEMICWSIRLQKDEREKLDKQMDRAKAANHFDIVDWCIEKMHEIDAIIEVLKQMYQIETGTEYCG